MISTSKSVIHKYTGSIHAMHGGLDYLLNKHCPLWVTVQNQINVLLYSI